MPGTHTTIGVERHLSLRGYRLSIFGTNMYMLCLSNRHQTWAVRTCIDFLMDKARSAEA